MTEYKKVFLDTAPLIYYLENNPVYHEYVKGFLCHCFQNGWSVITSAITVEEYCVYPYRNHDMKLIEKFQKFLQDMEISVIPIDRGVAKEAAKIRARFSEFKAMEALQLAVANISKCDIFLTNDRQLRQFTGIKCVLVDELV